jgi:hypothetical protein
MQRQTQQNQGKSQKNCREKLPKKSENRNSDNSARYAPWFTVGRVPFWHHILPTPGQIGHQTSKMAP